MSVPPANIAATELWRRITAAKRPSRVVDFPRKDENGEALGRYALRILLQEEYDEAAAAAERYAADMLKSTGSDLGLGRQAIYDNAVAVELVFRAARDANDIDVQLFPSPGHIRHALTSDEVGAIYQEFRILTAELGPLITQLSDAEMKAWIARLIEGGEHYPLGSFSFQALAMLANYIRSSVSKLELTSPTDTSSPGTPLANSSPEPFEKPSPESDGD